MKQDKVSVSIDEAIEVFATEASEEELSSEEDDTTDNQEDGETNVAEYTEQINLDLENALSKTAFCYGMGFKARKMREMDNMEIELHKEKRIAVSMGY